MFRICLSAPNTLGYPSGGHLWVFLNWALGFQSLGHEVIWLDVVNPNDSPEMIAQMLGVMRERLAAFGFSDRIALCTPEGESVSQESKLPVVPLESALTCDLLCDHRYNLPARVVERFKHSMLIDIDPGQLQIALDLGTYHPAPHSRYFTVGEWANFPKQTQVHSKGYDWTYTPPPVALDAWPVIQAAVDSAMTTVSGWYMKNEWMPDSAGNWYDNSKRAAFLPYLDVPKQTPLPLELCINIGSYEEEIHFLRDKGWRVIKSDSVNDPHDYRRYLQQSLGEFSCAKPAYVQMQTGWLSDRTACYLASGKPVVIQKTGPSDILPDDSGVLRFTTPDEAIQCLRHVQHNYESHALAARQIAEDHLDARKVLKRVLEQSI